MLRGSAAGLLCVALTGLAGCNRNDEPPPRFNELLEHEGEMLAPIPLSRPPVEGLPAVSVARYLKKIEGPAGAGGGGGANAAGAEGAEAGGAAAAIVLRDGTAEELAQQFAELAASGNIEGIVMMVVPEQQATARRVLKAAQAVEAAAKRIQEAAQSGAPDVAGQFAPNERGMIRVALPGGPGETAGRPVELLTASGLFGVGKRLEVGAVTPAGDTAATAAMRVDEREIRIDLVQADGKWRMRLPNMPDEGSAPALAGVLEAAAKAMGEVADSLEKGEIQPADVVSEIVKRVQQEAMQKAATGADQAGEPAKAGAPPGEELPPAESPPGERPPEEGAGGAAPAGGGSAGGPDRPQRSRSGRDVDNELPTVEETLGRQ